MPAPLPDRTTRLLGKTFGCLTVLAYAGDRDSAPLWICACDCGAPTITVLGKSLLRGNTKSCGHLRREVSRARLTIHGLGRLPFEGVMIHWNPDVTSPHKESKKRK